MQTATQVLEREQTVIRLVVAVIDQILEELEHRHTVDTDLLQDVIQFMRIFSDQCHHGKQESYLFPLLESKGVSSTACPLRDLRAEHVKGRRLTDELSSACSEYMRNQGEGRLAVTQALQSVVNFYSTHLWKEEYLLFPMAEKMLSAEENQILLEQFQVAESDISVGAHCAYEALAEDLHSRLRRSEAQQV